MDQIVKKTEEAQEKIWLSSPHMGGSEQRYIQQAFDQNWIAPLGPNVTGFEKDLEYFLQQNSHVAVVSSGTAALHLALVLLGVNRGDEVLCQSLTFAASANPIIYQGATPIFVDSEQDTLNISPYFLEKAIKDRLSKGKKPKAIIAVHLYGMPYKVDEIHTIAQKYEIPVVEDSAESLGSTYKGRCCGTFGDLSILSFNGNKIITTSGGGALVCKSLDQKRRAIFLATQARDKAPHYQHSCIGYNYRMSNISAGIGRGQMEVLERHVQRRREMNAFYRSIFQSKQGIRLLEEPNDDFYSNHWLSVIQLCDDLNSRYDRNGLKHHLDKQNIESRPLWKPMHMQPIFSGAPFYGDGTSESAFNTSLCLPSGSNLGEVQKLRIASSLKSFFENFSTSICS